MLRRWPQVCAGVLLALFLMVLAAAQSASVHKCLHSDADDHEHACCVTLMQSGQLDAATAPLPLAEFVGIPLKIFIPEPQANFSYQPFLPPGCGPPIC